MKSRVSIPRPICRASYKMCLRSVQNENTGLQREQGRQSVLPMAPCPIRGLVWVQVLEGPRQVDLGLAGAALPAKGQRWWSCLSRLTPPTCTSRPPTQASTGPLPKDTRSFSACRRALGWPGLKCKGMVSRGTSPQEVEARVSQSTKLQFRPAELSQSDFTFEFIDKMIKHFKTVTAEQ